MKNKDLGIFITFLLLTSPLRAQFQLPDSARQTHFVTRTMMYGVGVANMYDTYLSPQEYKGVEVRVARESMRMTRWTDGNLSLQNFLRTDLRLLLLKSYLLWNFPVQKMCLKSEHLLLSLE